MKIILLAHNLRVAGGKSVGQNIIRTLPEIAPMHEYLMIVPKDCGYPDFQSQKNISVLECPQMGLGKRWWWEKKVMRPAIDSFEPDWIWALGNFGLVNAPSKQSLLFHDAHHVDYPFSCNQYDFFQVLGKIFKISFINFKINSTLQDINKVYVQTSVMRKRFFSKYKYPIQNIYKCPNSISFSINSSEFSLKELKIGKDKFVLFILSKYYPHKNFDRVVKTFSIFKEELKDIICIIPVRADQGKRAAQLIKTVDRAGLSDQIIFVDPIPQERLGEFFHAADVMFLPTLLESFSGTYLEAMHLDTPILTSDLDFAREICGPAAEYVDPYSLESMRDGILRLKNDAARREELILLGREQLQRYVRSWPDILRDVLDQEGIGHG